MGVVGGDMLLSSAPMPDADLLRFCNDLGFVMVGVPGMLAAALGIGALSFQAHAAGIVGKRLRLVSRGDAHKGSAGALERGSLRISSTSGDLPIGYAVRPF
jgi:hypothetical protein